MDYCYVTKYTGINSNCITKKSFCINKIKKNSYFTYSLNL